MPVDVVVAGAGVAGLYAALLLARSGARVRVLERASRPYGLAGSEAFRGIPCDLGSHRLHREALDRPLFRELHAREPFLERPRRGVLVLGDRRVPYPPSPLAMLRALGPRASLELGVGFALRGARRRAFDRWDDDRAGLRDDGFERFVTDRVGSAAYRAFYEPYARKVWGIEPADLSQIVAKKRLSSRSPWSLLGGLAAPLLAAVGVAPAVAPTFLYPARGIASVAEHLARELASLGVAIELDHPYRPGEIRGAAVLHAGDLGAIVPTSLTSRGLYLVYLAFVGAREPTCETCYAPSPVHWFGRVSELSGYSPALQRPGETVLCVEIPEGSWGPGLDFASGPRLETLLAQLDHAGIAPRGARLLASHQRFVPGVYPLYRRGFRDAWRAAMRRIPEGTLPIGRQALFLHVNLDHVAAIAEEAVAHLAAGGSTRAWVAHAERWLDVPVRD